MGEANGLGPVRGMGFYGAGTDAVRPCDRFDYWRSLFGDPDMAPLPDHVGAPYRGALIGCDGDDGLTVTDLACTPTTTRFVEGENDYLRLCVPVRGELRVTHGNDVRDRLRPGGGFQVYDGRRAAQVDSVTGYRAHFITLPRALAVATMGADPIGDAACVALPRTPLSQLLEAQLAALSRLGPRMDAEESAAAMAALSGVALACLGRFARDRRDDAREAAAADAALFAAARAFIAAHAESPGLTAAAIAAAIGCSRTRLFGLFQARGLTVAEAIRTARLAHARALLRTGALDIGEVALRCGYSDGSAFGKAFRRAFGLSPRDWRMSAC